MPIRFAGKPGLVAYLTAGDPDLKTTHQIALAAIDAGADVIELGVPFSDPLADGPVIQRASERALLNGPSKPATRLVDVLGLAAELRKERPDAGLVIFSYYNPVLRFGLERFCAEAEAAGVDGVLVTDLIVEEAGEYLALLERHHLAPIFLAAPTSPDARLERIGAVSKGFVYAISRLGITGIRTTLASDAKQLVDRLRRYTPLPIAVGFGVSNAEHFAAVGEFADAAVIGSAIVQLIEESTPEEAPSSIARFIRGLRTPVLQAR
ncbi:tryptophan synthase alpha chain [Silvibacterium bohemicum]|uniref:Tryptophan synthase alpha chain n=1 Tax=Silvibacterium bohemicum TaxID=1577686 RepID=A0A841K5U3_9BACT|nr:tryptophan synthase subunit alpha [Silvibacterium bohemicum]MBB6145968.1 tryptophan synthase alpha chain [Silvibacterium bohemicum]